MFTILDTTCAGLDAVVLRDEEAGSSVTVVPSRGALVTSFFALGREWLHLDQATLQDPTKNVRGGIPVLFPSPGKLRDDAFSRSGRSGAMKQHGFARNSAFLEVDRGADGSASVTLELVDSESARSSYPFAFRFRLAVRLSGAQLHLRAEVRNTGAGELPFALGYHPYFAVPVEEKARARIPTRATRAWDNKNERDVALGALDLTEGEVDLHLLDHGATAATLVTPRGQVEIGGDFERWVIWTLPGQPFVCLEPWTSPADALNTGVGLISLAPGAERVMALQIAVRE